MRPYSNNHNKAKGRPKWFDTQRPFNLKDKETWDTPTQSITQAWRTKKGKEYTVTIQTWDNLRSRGKHNIPMHNVPLTAIKIDVVNNKNQPVYNRSLWLIVVGKWQEQISLSDIWQSYKSRFNIEHFFKFAKSRLLMDAYQTPKTTNEENWTYFVILSYHQLFHARIAAKDMPYPWDTKRNSSAAMSPRRVQRDMARILKIVGPTALPPKQRGIPAGRKANKVRTSRKELPVIKSAAQTYCSKGIRVNWTFRKDNKIAKPRINYIGIDKHAIPAKIQTILDKIIDGKAQQNAPPT